MRERMFKMFLAAIRIAIGWHFLYEGLWKLMQKDGWSCASYLAGAQGPLAGLFKWMSSQGWIVAAGDYAVMWGLVAMGLALITGVLARVAAVFGVALLAMFYAAQPPEPFAAAVSGADGRFFVVERNVIEILGLVAVAAFPAWLGWLRTALPGALALALFGWAAHGQWKAKAFEKVETVTSATVKVHEFTALAALKDKFTERAVVGDVEISRLALGGDLIAGHAHARDLIWADDFMRRYNGGVTLGRTVRYCLHCGVDTAFVEPAFIAPMRDAAKAFGGEMKFFANCADAKDAELAASAGASALYMRPETADALAKKGDADGLKALFAALKAAKLPVGVGAEDVATVKFCAERGVAPDFWLLAYHSLNYPAATMPVKCNNIWCADPEAAAAYMKTRKEPWVAIRSLAGGAINPIEAYKFACGGGAAAVAMDLLDYRIVDTVNGVAKKKAGEPAKKGKEAAK